MPKYMTQSMSSGVHKKITYYRKQKNDHPSHADSGAFTTAAKAAYVNTNTVNEADVELGTYRSRQGVPRSGDVEEI